MSLNDWAKARIAALDAWARPWAQRCRLNGWAYEFLLFGLKQAWASLFGAAMLVLILGAHFFWPANAPLARYDFLVFAAVGIQAFMLTTRLERWDEAAVIAIFHVVGTAMEVFKTWHGSWVYPEHSLLHIGGVPLFSGFMYASIGSYIARARRLFDIRFVGYGPLWAPWVLSILSYINFFAHHYGPDIRIGLFVLSAVMWRKGWFVFTPDLKRRRLPMLLGVLLIALFIWIAENLGTFGGAWVYPSQRHGWHMVPIAKMGAWYLLIILSFVLTTLVHPPKAPGADDLGARPTI